MHIFWWIPGMLCVATCIVESIQRLVERHRMMNPYIGHFNYRDNRVGRYYSNRH